MIPANPVTTARAAWPLTHTTLYRIEALPDCEDPVYRLMAGGDVQRAIRECHVLLVRTLATYPAGSAALTIRFVFTPAAEPSERQNRLALTLQASARDNSVAQTLRLLIECSDLAAYYGLGEPSTTDPQPFQGPVGCHITRAEQAIRPLHPPEDNPAIPPVYYVCRPFMARSNNDYRGLDRILDRVKEPVQFEMTLEPADVTPERFLHSRYLARLQSINRLCGYDDEDGHAQGDPFEPDLYPRSARSAVIQPLRRRDPIADDILSGHRSFHETLGQPHLAFHMEVRAHTPAVAGLIASAVAESAFDKGSYRLWPIHGQAEQSAPSPSPDLNAGDVSVPSLDLVLGEHAAAYRGFSRLAHVATVDELLSAFTLPIASRGGPRCIRKNTEPPSVPRERLLIFGHDEKEENDRA